MTRRDAADFLKIAAEIQLRPRVTTFGLGQINEALAAVRNDKLSGPAVILPDS
jgi:propanol-preferring alcohol dehydrogenase